MTPAQIDDLARRIIAAVPRWEVDSDAHDAFAITRGLLRAALSSASPPTPPPDEGERGRAIYVTTLELSAAVADGWANHYPEDVWPPGGTSLDSRAAAHGRHVAKQIALDLRKMAAAPRPPSSPDPVRCTCYPGHPEGHWEGCPALRSHSP